MGFADLDELLHDCRDIMTDAQKRENARRKEHERQYAEEYQGPQAQDEALPKIKEILNKKTIDGFRKELQHHTRTLDHQLRDFMERREEYLREHYDNGDEDGFTTKRYFTVRMREKGDIRKAFEDGLVALATEDMRAVKHYAKLANISKTTYEKTSTLDAFVEQVLENKELFVHDKDFREEMKRFLPRYHEKRTEVAEYVTDAQLTLEIERRPENYIPEEVLAQKNWREKHQFVATLNTIEIYSTKAKEEHNLETRHLETMTGRVKSLKREERKLSRFIGTTYDKVLTDVLGLTITVPNGILLYNARDTVLEHEKRHTEGDDHQIEYKGEGMPIEHNQYELGQMRKRRNEARHRLNRKGARLTEERKNRLMYGIWMDLFYHNNPHVRNGYVRQQAPLEVQILLPHVKEEMEKGALSHQSLYSVVREIEEHEEIQELGVEKVVDYVSDVLQYAFDIRS